MKLIKNILKLKMRTLKQMTDFSEKATGYSDLKISRGRHRNKGKHIRHNSQTFYPYEFVKIVLTCLWSARYVLLVVTCLTKSAETVNGKYKIIAEEMLNGCLTQTDAVDT